MTPFSEGEKAARRGALRSDCPHPAGSGAQAEWLAGWEYEEGERARDLEEYERDMEPYTRPHREGDAA